jgi:hypothetical protein
MATVVQLAPMNPSPARLARYRRHEVFRMAVALSVPEPFAKQAIRQFH